MRYTRLTAHEVDQIEQLLERHSVNFQVTLDEELITAQKEADANGRSASRPKRRTNALFNLHLEKDEFDKLSPEGRHSLERLGIVPEVLAGPFQADTPLIASPFEASPTPRKLKLIDLVLLVVVSSYLFLRWLDRYVTPIFP